VTNWPSRDPSVYVRPGASSIRPAALWDAIYELVVGSTVGITAEGAGLLVQQGVQAHEARADDPHAAADYVTVAEGDIRWGASSGLAPHTHEAADSGGVIDYLRTQWGADHLAAPDPHDQYLQQAAVQAMIDGAITNLKNEPDPFPIYLTQGEADLLYLPVSYTPPPTDLSNYYTKAQASAAFVDAVGDTMTGDLTITKSGPPLLGLRQQGDTFNRFQVSQIGLTVGPGNLSGDTQFYRSAVATWTVLGHVLPSTTNADDLGNTGFRWRKAWATDADLSGALTVAAKAVALSPNAGNTLQWLATGFYSDSPSKATIDALTSRVATLEAQVAALQGQMGAGATGHYHTMGTWRQTNKATIPVTQVQAQEAVSA